MLPQIREILGAVEALKASATFHARGNIEKLTIVAPTVTLTDVLVSSFQSGAGGDDVTDQFSLAFRTLRIKEVEQTPKGTPGDAVEAAFDFVRRRAL